MTRYGVTGMTAATAAAAENSIAALWNPSTTKTIYVVQIHLFKQGAVGAVTDVAYVRKLSARGTVTTPFVPGIEADMENAALAPVSAAALDTVYTVQPTYL